MHAYACRCMVPGMVASRPPQDDVPSPFDGLDDVQVLELAKAALRRVHVAPLTSIERAVQWNVYEQAKAELDMRLFLFITNKLRQGK
jgi:hypothetical protein